MRRTVEAADVIIFHEGDLDESDRAIDPAWCNHLASVDADGHVVLNAEAFVADQGFEEKVWFFGRNLRDHIAAGAHNLAGETPPQLDRSVYYGHLSRASQQELEALGRELGMAALRQVNQRALELQRRDSERSDEPSHHINFGVYFYADPAGDSEPECEDTPGG